MKILKTLSILFALPLAAIAAESGPLHQGSMPEPGKAGPTHASKLYVSSSNIQGGAATLQLPVDTPAGAVLVVFDEQPLQVTATRGSKEQRLPSRGYRDPALATMNVPEVGSSIPLDELAPGSHAIDVASARSSGQLRYALLQPESPVEMRLQATPLAARSGDTITLTAQLPVGADEVMARVRGVGKLALLDDGSGADAVAGDGTYTAAFTAPRLQGMQEMVMRVDAAGQLDDGLEYRRTGSTRSMVSGKALALSPENVEQRPDALLLDIAARGRFRVEAVYGNGDTALAYARDNVSLSGRNAVVELPRPAEAAAADTAVIRVLDRDSLGLAAEFEMAIEPQAGGSDAPAIERATLPRSKQEAARQHGSVRR